MLDAFLRRTERIEVELPVRLFIPGEGELRFEAFASTYDLGLDLLFVRSTFLLRPETDLLVEIGLPDGPLTAPATVVRVVDSDAPDPLGGMELAFRQLDRLCRERLLRYFAPERHRRFFAELVSEFPHLEQELPLSDVAFVLNLWEEWKTRNPSPPEADGEPEGRKRGGSSRAVKSRAGSAPALRRIP